MEERELFNNRCESVGQTYFVGDEIPKGLYHMVVMIAIENSAGEFLMQKRSPEKGEEWAVTGGHQKKGETSIRCIINEVREELGVDISGDKIEEFDSGFDGHHCYKWYYVKKDFDIKELVIQKSELTDVKWFSKKALEMMIENRELSNNQIAFLLKCFDYLNSKK